MWYIIGSIKNCPISIIMLNSRSFHGAIYNNIITTCIINPYIALILFHVVSLYPWYLFIRGLVFLIPFLFAPQHPTNITK